MFACVAQVVVKSEIGRLLRYRVRQGIVEGREQEATDRSIRTAVEEVVKALRSFVLHMDTDKLTPHAGVSAARIVMPSTMLCVGLCAILCRVYCCS